MARQLFTRKRLVSILVAIALVAALGYYLYLSQLAPRSMPILMATVDVQAVIPEGASVYGDFVEHCGDHYDPYGVINAFSPIPAGAAAAVYLSAESWPEAVGASGHEPALFYLIGGEPLLMKSRLYPQQVLFAVEMRGGSFVVPPGVLLAPTEESGYSTQYEWSEDGVSFTVTESFQFEHGGPARIREPTRPGLCA